MHLLDDDDGGALGRCSDAGQGVLWVVPAWRMGMQIDQDADSAPVSTDGAATRGACFGAYYSSRLISTQSSLGPACCKTSKG